MATMAYADAAAGNSYDRNTLINFGEKKVRGLDLVQRTLQRSLPTASPNQPSRPVGPNVTASCAVAPGREGRELTSELS